MNDNIDLTKILEGCPKGTEFYSPLFGKVAFSNIDLDMTYPIRTNQANFASDGRYISRFNGECMLFPSKDQRSWAKFERFWDKPKVEKFDVNTLQPFDKILAREYRDNKWSIELFSHKTDNIVNGLCYNWHYAIPFNEETKHLVGTKKDCPDYYKWWEE